MTDSAPIPDSGFGPTALARSTFPERRPGGDAQAAGSVRPGNSDAARQALSPVGALSQSSQSGEAGQAIATQAAISGPSAVAASLVGSASPDQRPAGLNQASFASSGDSEPGELTEEEQQQVRELQARDQEVRAHEQAHARVGGQYAGAPRYEFVTGPDGRRYAVSGSVSIDVSPVPGDPEATANKARTVQRAALAPAEPSGQDRRVAQEAGELLREAQREVQAQRNAEREAQLEAGRDAARPDQPGAPETPASDFEGLAPVVDTALQPQPVPEGTTGAAVSGTGVSGTASGEGSAPPFQPTPAPQASGAASEGFGGEVSGLVSNSPEAAGGATVTRRILARQLLTEAEGGSAAGAPGALLNLSV